MLPVAVEVAPPNAPREHAAALLAACSRAVAQAECVPAGEAPEGGTQAVAIVTWHGDERVVVEVGLRAEGKPIWRSRNLTFNAEDAVVERWRAVGYVVGTLARDERPADEPAPPAQPEAKKAAPPPAPVAKAPVATDEGIKPPTSAKPAHSGPARAVIDVGAVVGPAWSGIRSGGLVRTRWPLQDPLRIQVSARYLERGADETGLSAQWFTLGAGLGTVLGTDVLEASASLEFRAEYFLPRAEDYFGRADEEGRVLSGLALGLNGAWMPSPTLGLYLGGEVGVVFSKTTIEVYGQPPVVDGPWRLAADAGVRLKLW